MLTFINFCFLKRTKFFDVFNVCCCCCCLILLFVLTRFLNICISQQFNASIFTQLSYLLWTLSYRSYTIFLKITWDFMGFLVFPKSNFWVLYLFLICVDNYADKVWMGGVGTLCAIAHCWAALFSSGIRTWMTHSIKRNLELLEPDSAMGDKQSIWFVHHKGQLETFMGLM